MGDINWNNKEEVLKIVKENGDALHHASEELRSDKEIVLAAVSKHGWALEYASEELRSNKEVVLVAVRKDGYTLQYVSEELREDSEIVFEAVKGHGMALEFASEKLRSNREIVLEAVKMFGEAYNFAVGEVREDKEICVMASKKLLDEEEYLRKMEDEEEMKYDLSIWNELYRNIKEVTKNLSIQEVIEIIKSYDVSVLYLFSDTIKSNKELMLGVIKYDKKALEYVS